MTFYFGPGGNESLFRLQTSGGLVEFSGTVEPENPPWGDPVDLHFRSESSDPPTWVKVQLTRTQLKMLALFAWHWSCGNKTQIRYEEIARQLGAGHAVGEGSAFVNHHAPKCNKALRAIAGVAGDTQCIGSGEGYRRFLWAVTCSESATGKRIGEKKYSARESKQLRDYLNSVIANCSELPSYFPKRLQLAGGLPRIRQRVQVVTKPEEFDSRTLKLTERLRAEGLDDDLPLRSTMPDHPFGSTESQQTLGETLQWSALREPRTAREKESFRRTIVLGDPGFGKTWLLRHEAIRLAEEALQSGREFDDIREIPVLVRLPSIARHIEGRSLDEAVLSYLRTVECQGSLVVEALERGFKEGRVALLLDGWDEVDAKVPVTWQEDPRFETFEEKIDGFANTYQGRVLLTSRRTRYEFGSVMGSAAEVQIVAFGSDEVQGFITDWFAGKDPQTGKAFLAELENQWRVSGLTRIPMLLALMCSAYEATGRLPETRSQLYHQALYDLMVEGPKGQVPRGRSARPIPGSFGFKQYLKRLSHLAWELQLKQEFDEGHLRKAFGAPGEDFDSFEEFVNRVEHAGVLTRVGERWMFLHRSFQEYLTAVGLAEQDDDDIVEQIRGYSMDRAWHESIALLGGVLTMHDVSCSCVPKGRYISKLLIITEELGRESEECLTQQLFPRLALAGRVLAESGDEGAEGLGRRRKEILDALWTLWRQTLANSTNAAFDHVRRSLADLVTADASLAEAFLDDPKAGAEVGARTRAVAFLLVGPLLGRLQDRRKDKWVRKNAAGALGLLGPSVAEQVVGPLLEHLQDGKEEGLVRKHVASALGRLGPSVAEQVAGPLLKRLQDRKEYDEVRASAAGALGQLGPSVAEQVVGPLLEMLQDRKEHDEVRGNAAIVLGQLGPSVAEQVVGPLLKRLQDRKEYDEVRASAAGALGQLGPSVAEQVVGPLLEMLRDRKENYAVRASAAGALGQLGQLGPSVAEHVVGPLLEMLQDCKEDYAVRRNAALVLGLLGPNVAEQVVGPLLKRLQDGKEYGEVRVSAAWALRQLGPSVAEQMVGPLLEMLQDRKEENGVRWLAAEALGRQGPSVAEYEQFVGTLLEQMQDVKVDYWERASAAEALGQLAPAGLP